MSCRKCHGTGFEIVTTASGVSGARPCACRDKARPALLLEAAKIPSLYRNASFATFSAAHAPQLAPVVTAVKAFVRAFPCADRPGLLLTGPIGTGKTYLAVAALRALIERGFAGLFLEYPDLLDTIQASYDPAAAGPTREAYTDAQDAPLLLLDDLGARRVSDWVEDTVTTILMRRCNDERPTIITTNLRDEPPSATGTTLAERIGARACSRLYEMCVVVEMPGWGDYRRLR